MACIFFNKAAELIQAFVHHLRQLLQGSGPVIGLNVAQHLEYGLMLIWIALSIMDTVRDIHKLEQQKPHGHLIHLPTVRLSVD